MKPYYEHGGITIYHGDSAEVMPELGEFDLLLADPPYGIGESSKKVASRGKLAAPTDYGHFDWDQATVPAEVLSMALVRTEYQIIWGGNYYTLPPTSCWLIWDKENTRDFADAELAWTNLPKAVRLIRHMWNGMLRKGGEARFHPTQKPLDVIAWALRQAPETVHSVLDPWMGSGTTLRACKDAGKQCVGIDREEQWCEIAAMRLEQEVFAM